MPSAAALAAAGVSAGASAAVCCWWYAGGSGQQQQHQQPPPSTVAPAPTALVERLQATPLRFGCVTLHAVIDENFVVPGFEPATTQRASYAEALPVGKGISCSNALSDLGHAGDTAVLVLCGAADTGLYQSALAPHTFGQVQVLGGPPQTRRHVTIIDPGSRSPVTHVQVPGVPHPLHLFAAGSPLTMAVRSMGMTAAAANADSGGGVAVVALSGSLPKGAPTDYYATLVRAIQQGPGGGRAVLDTSGAALEAGLRAAPWAVKPNRGEAEVLLGRRLATAESVGVQAVAAARAAAGAGGDSSTAAAAAAAADHAAAAAEIRARWGVEWVLLSDGEAGLVVACSAGAWHCRAELDSTDRAGIVNDQGCGDAAVAGFMSGALLSGVAAAAVGQPPQPQQVELMARRAVLASTCNLFTSTPGQLSAAHLRRFGEGGADERRVRVTQLLDVGH